MGPGAPCSGTRCRPCCRSAPGWPSWLRPQPGSAAHNPPAPAAAPPAPEQQHRTPVNTAEPTTGQPSRAGPGRAGRSLGVWSCLTCCFCFSPLLKASALVLAAVSFCCAAFSSCSRSASAFFIFFSSTWYFSSARLCTSSVIRNVSSLSAATATQRSGFWRVEEHVRSQVTGVCLCLLTDGRPQPLQLLLLLMEGALLQFGLQNLLLLHLQLTLLLQLPIPEGEKERRRVCPLQARRPGAHGYILVCSCPQTSQLAFNILKLGLFAVQLIPNVLQLLQAGQNRCSLGTSTWEVTKQGNHAFDSNRSI